MWHHKAKRLDKKTRSLLYGCVTKEWLLELILEIDLDSLWSSLTLDEKIDKIMDQVEIDTGERPTKQQILNLLYCTNRIKYI